MKLAFLYQAIALQLFLLLSGGLNNLCASNALSITNKTDSIKPETINLSAQDVISMQFKLGSLIGEIRVNGIPIYCNPGNNDMDLGNRGEWLKNGINSVEIEGYWPENTPYEADEAEASAEVLHISTDKSYHDKSVICLSLNRTAGKDSAPFYVSGQLNLSGLPETKLWNETETLKEITPSDRQAIVDCLKELAQALDAGDSLLISHSLQIPLSEVFLTSTTPEADFELFMGMMMIAPLLENWKMKPIEEESLTFRIVGNGHLVWVTRKENAPVIETIDTNEMPWNKQVYLGKINGKWHIIR